MPYLYCTIDTRLHRHNQYCSHTTRNMSAELQLVPYWQEKKQMGRTKEQRCCYYPIHITESVWWEKQQFYGSSYWQHSRVDSRCTCRGPAFHNGTISHGLGGLLTLLKRFSLTKLELWTSVLVFHLLHPHSEQPLSTYSLGNAIFLLNMTLKWWLSHWVLFLPSPLYMWFLKIRRLIPWLPASLLSLSDSKACGAENILLMSARRRRQKPAGHMSSAYF